MFWLCVGYVVDHGFGQLPKARIALVTPQSIQNQRKATQSPDSSSDAAGRLHLGRRPPMRPTGRMSGRKVGERGLHTDEFGFDHNATPCSSGSPLTSGVSPQAVRYIGATIGFRTTNGNGNGCKKWLRTITKPVPSKLYLGSLFRASFTWVESLSPWWPPPSQGYTTGSRHV